MRSSAVLCVYLSVCLLVHNVVTSRVILVENAPTCFRRVLAGRRALRSFVRRVVPCERLEDCRRECAEERRFHCESFNYRLDPSFRGKGLCEMMTKPIEAFDLRRDFVEDKDYDFYELDRNSLEPHCPETLRGPGLLHSGFLSSKPNKESYQNSWDRTDYSDRGYDRTYNRFYDDRRVDRNYGGARRRHEDQFFVPYQIGLARSNEDQDTWGQYGGSYGNSYYKDRNDYHKSISHWGLNDLEPPPPVYGVRPLVNQNFNYHDLSKKIDRYGYGSWKRGRWNVSGPSGSGNGLDYGESSYYKPPKPVFYESTESHERSDEAVVKDCTSRRRPGMSLGSGAIRRSLLARTVVQCEAACFNEREFKCVSYSYRYSNSHGSDNCFLSERPYRGLQLSADSGSDVYAMPEDHGCSATTKPFVESECFWHVRSGAAVGDAAVRAALTVAGLGACEAECIRAHAFFCRGFSFRFDSPTIGDDLENCILTSTPPTSLDAGRGLRPTAGHELYARGNYGRGCEPALYDDLHQGETGECYLQYDAAAKLIGTSIKGQARVKNERSCGQACTNAPFRCLSFSYNNNAPPDIDNCLLSEIRLFDLQRGVDYEHSTDDWLFAFDLFNGQCWRKVHGRGDHDQPVPELPRPLSPPPPDTYSSSGPSSPSGPSSGPSGPSGYLPGPPAPAEPYLPSGPPSGPSYKPYDRPDFKPSYPGSYPAAPGYLPKPRPEYTPSEPYRPSGPSGARPSGPGYLPTGGSYPTGPYRPSGPPGPPSGPYPPTGSYRPDPPYAPDLNGPYGPGSHRPARPGYPDTAYGPPVGPVRPLGLRPGDREEEPIALSWRHYTVSGFPCRKGTTCAQNQVAGHWACEPEGGEIGSWDYCCAPTHRCGYSEGFHKPWCYVGPSQDQWRPCSEKYYPYHQHNIPHPTQGHRGPGPDRLPNRPPPSNFDRPDLSYLPEADRRYWDDLYNNGPQAYYDKYGNPLPGYTRVPTEDRPYIKYRHNYPRPASGQWVPVAAVPGEADPPVPGGLGAPRYWPVAYLHKSPPPNTTYFKYNHTERPSSATERYDIHPPPRDNHVPRDPPPNRGNNDEPSTSFRDNSRDPSSFRDNSQDPSMFSDTPREPPASREPSRDRNPPRERPSPSYTNVNPDRPPNNNIDNKSNRDDKKINVTNVDEDIFNVNLDKVTTTTPKAEVKVTEPPKANESKAEVEAVKVVEAEKPKVDKELDNLKGIDDKIDDFSSSIEVLDIEDAKKGDKLADLKTLEAEERQIEAIGRLLAARRGGKLVLEKRSQKDLETKSIALDKDLVDFNFGNKFPTATERRGTVQRVTKDEIKRERNIDKSLEVSETTFVRPPRVLSTTENIRKTVVNGKVFYSASVREQRDLINNSTRKAKSLNLRPLEERAPSVIANNNYGKKKVIRARNVNPVRKVRRVYRRKYNPDEVRRRLLERERSMKENADKKD
ncbi:uncharacterized protein LOC126378334 [Pectinophora gossypiella]|uniref:uncharacterized protein LOC126378334 n=1 Tax=Pectinophora gossypiella TaxID=13191 RepID=UPI00214EA4AB|nr:uncharacterized protein LOC126378334 [Pectinophora gossypiella]